MSKYADSNDKDEDDFGPDNEDGFSESDMKSFGEYVAQEAMGIAFSGKKHYDIDQMLKDWQQTG